MATTAELTEKYLAGHPSIKDCLSMGLVNYTKLSRKIASELGAEKKTSIEAILIACRRYERKISEGRIHEGSILALLRKSELEIRNRIMIAVIDKGIYGETLIDLEKKAWKERGTFYAIEGSRSFTLMFSERYEDDVRKAFGRNVVSSTSGLAMIIIKSPEEIESTPGIMAYLYSIFWEHGININQTMSCHTDTIFVISEGGIPRVMEFLRF